MTVILKKNKNDMNYILAHFIIWGGTKNVSLATENLSLEVGNSLLTTVSVISYFTKSR